MTTFPPPGRPRDSSQIINTVTHEHSSGWPQFVIAVNGLNICGPGWKEAFSVTQVARCQLYNTMEPDHKWHDVKVDWKSARVGEGHWRLPCRVEIPFVGEVLKFDILGKHRRGLDAWDLSIPADSIQEKDPTLARLLTIDLLPEFTKAEQGSEGYLFLPCLSGALHNFHHKVSRETRITLYGRQEQWAYRCQYNAFGMHRPDLSWFAIVTQGDLDAEAVAHSHWEEDKTYGVHAGLVYRWESNDELLPGTRTVRYYLRNPQDSNDSGWAAFARIYRRYQREERRLKTWLEKAENNPDVLNLARGFLLKIMQGYKASSLDGTGAYQSMTSFQEAQKLLGTMRHDGISSFITAQMVGWNNEGHDGTYPSRFPVNPAEGGETEFRQLIDWGQRSNIGITVHDNYSDSYQISPDFDLNDVIVLRDGRNWRNIPWSGGFNWRLCPLQSIQKAKRELPRMRALGINGNYYLDAIGAFMTCHSLQHGANRAQMMEAFTDLFDLTRDSFGTVSTEVACASFLSHIDGVYMDGDEHLLDNFTPFRQQWVDETVPFAAIVMHNSIRYQRRDDAGFGAGGRAAALRALSIGAMPFVEISARPAPGAHQMPQYQHVAPFCRVAHQLCCVDHVDLVTYDLEDVQAPEPDFFHSRFEDGVELFINAGTEAITWQGLRLPPLSVRRIAV